MSAKVYLLLCIVGSAYIASATANEGASEEKSEQSNKADEAWLPDYMKIIDMPERRGWYKEVEEARDIELTPDEVLQILLRLKKTIPKTEPLFREEVDELIELNDISGSYCTSDLMKRYVNDYIDNDDKVLVYLEDRKLKQVALCKTLFEDELDEGLEELSETEKEDLETLISAKLVHFEPDDELDLDNLLLISRNFLESIYGSLEEKVSGLRKKHKLENALRPLWDLCKRVDDELPTILDIYAGISKETQFDEVELDYVNKAHVCKQLIGKRRDIFDSFYDSVKEQSGWF